MSTNSSIKPITLYGEAGPNPPKVAMILSELNLPYKIEGVPFADVKKPYYTALNPNGRLPTIQDPNTDLTLWESGAIIEYLIDRYDTNHTLSFPTGTNESFLTKQWLHFQISGQGPYYGQAVWFHKFHAEQIPSAQDRYVKEINRVTGVLESWLEKQKAEYAGKGGDGPWLVGNKVTYADIAFVQWQRLIPGLLGPEKYDLNAYPHVKEWLGKLMAREKVKKIIDETDAKR